MTLVLATDDSGGPEIFASLQGEGPSQGRPCAFIRLSRCNLACVWCDTPYTWHFEGDERPHRSGATWDRKANQVALDTAEAAARIAALGQDRLVVTGGEPLLQGAALAKLLALLGVRPREGGGLGQTDTAHAARGPRLRGDSLGVEIETNGTIAPHPALDPLVAQFTVSPKLAHSGNPADLALPPERLAAWAADPRAVFKFVVSQPADVDEVLALAAACAIPRERIWLMAEGTDPATLHTRERWLSQLCIEHRLTLSKRLHIELYGDTRGT